MFIGSFKSKQNKIHMYLVICYVNNDYVPQNKEQIANKRYFIFYKTKNIEKIFINHFIQF